MMNRPDELKTIKNNLAASLKLKLKPCDKLELVDKCVDEKIG